MLHTKKQTKRSHYPTNFSRIKIAQSISGVGSWNYQLMEIHDFICSEAVNE